MSEEQEAVYRACAGGELVRLSLGLKDARDVVADFQQALV